MRLIDATALKRELLDITFGRNINYFDIEKIIDKAQIHKIPSGYWIHKNDDHFDWLECSSCGYGDEGENDVEWNYCPVCGARMKKEESHEES